MMNMNDGRYLTMLQEQKKVAVVTGRANGIGKCIAAACRPRREPDGYSKYGSVPVFRQGRIHYR